MKSKDPKISLLKKVPTLAGCSSKELASIARLTETASFSAGETLVREGSPGVQAFLIASGIASVALHGHLVARLGPGEFVGEMSLLDRAPSSATVTAQTDLRAFVISQADFDHLADLPAVSRAIVRALARRLRLSQGAVQSYQPGPSASQ